MKAELNPGGSPSIREAIKEYEDRTLLKATKATPLDVFAPQGILTTLGPVHAITYTGTLQGDTALYEHTFEGPAGPLLVVDETNAIHLVGGEYHVSNLGIEDGAGPSPRANPIALDGPHATNAGMGRVWDIMDGAKVGQVLQTAKDHFRVELRTYIQTAPGIADVEITKKNLSRTIEDAERWARENYRAAVAPAREDVESFDRLIEEERRELEQLARHHPEAFGVGNPTNPAFSKAPLGEGGRFAACVAKVSRQPGVYDPEGLCASIGRKKYGAKKMAAMAKAGRRNPAMTYRDYWDEIDRIASDDLGASPDALEEVYGTDDPYEVATQIVDSHEFIIYYAKAFKVMEYTENDDAWFEANGAPPDVDSFNAMLTPLALYAMLADIMSRRGYENPASVSEARRREHAATTAQERHHWRRKKGEAMRRGNPVVTNRVSPNSPVDNAGFLAMAMPGGGPYGLPRANAGALAAAPNYPGDYDFPGVANGSHGLLGPQIRRNVPGQPIANPARSNKPGKWTRAPAHGIAYGIKVSDPGGRGGWAQILAYKPRNKDPVVAWNSRSDAGAYEQATGQKPPKGTKYLVRVLPPGSEWGAERWSAHKTLAPAKKRAEKELRSRANPGPDLHGYERTKRELKSAARLIDEGSYRAADQAIRGSGASRMDLENLLGKSRIAKMQKWTKTARAHGV
tara:strand:- start:292 stop:2343 length:2052 start_codon:yes stop_codon:yes gene_type:complete